MSIKAESFTEFTNNDILHPEMAGGIAFHAQIHPGIYPHDAEDQDAALVQPLESLPNPQAFLQNTLLPALANGTVMQRLRVLPALNSKNRSDIISTINWHTQMNECGETNRFAWGGDILNGQLLRYCGQNALVQAYFAGIESGQPTNSFWSLQRAGTNETPPHAIRLMHYQHDEFQSPEMVYPPLSSELQRFHGFWRRVFNDNHASFGVQAALEYGEHLA